MKDIEVTFAIEGMTCSACSARIERGIKKLEGVKDVKVNLATDQSTVTFEEQAITLYQIEEKIDSLGFRVKPNEIEFDVSGMSCAACATRIEKKLNRMDGIKKASVNLALERAQVEYHSSLVSPTDMIGSVSKLGFTLTNRLEEVESTNQDYQKLKIHMWLAILLSFPLFWAMADHFTFTSFIWIPELFMNPWFQMALATPVQFAIGARFYRSAYKALLNKSANMDVLVALGTSAAYLYSVFLTYQSLSTYTGHARVVDIEIILMMIVFIGFIFTYLAVSERNIPIDIPIIGGGTLLYLVTYYLSISRLNEHEAVMPDLYFETSAVLITLILVGKLLESRAKGHSSEAIKKLLRLQAKQATVLNGQEEVIVHVSEVQENDLLLVKAGEKFPTDGVIVRGKTSIDESMLTGESIPVDKGPGENVYGATINTNGAIVIRATSVGNQTMLSQIIRFVEEAQQSKAPIQRFADKASAVFVPIVIALAVVTFIIWFTVVGPGDLPTALETFISVLVISCPCALGLATPTSIMAGSGKAAEFGVLFRGGEHLESAQRVDTVVLDKTGTLTKGEPVLKETYCVGRIKESVWGPLVLQAEKSSNHPLAKAIVDGFNSKGWKATASFHVQEESGFGLVAKNEEYHLLIGTTTLMDKHNLPYEHAMDQMANSEAAGETEVLVALNGEVVGLITLADTIKPTSLEAVTSLHSLGMRVIMLTGDNPYTAKAIADQVGIKEFKARVLPNNKAEVIKELQSEGSIVAMVGDGMNDAPALAQANTGIALGTGADIAIESSDITLISGDLTKVPLALSMSKRTMRNIKQNLFWALAYNSIGIPVAAAGFLAPWVAGTAMAFSSVSVVLNSLRLQRMKLK